MKKIFRISHFISLSILLLFIVYSFSIPPTLNPKEKQEITIGWPFKIEEVQPLCDYIAKKTGKKVIVIKIKSIKEVKEKFKDKSLDFCFMNGFGYVLISHEMDIPIEPLVVLGTDKGNPATYHSCIIANSKVSLTTINDIKGKAKQYSIAFVSPSSTSGHLAPRLAFSALRMNSAEEEFKKVIFADSHSKVIQKVKDQEIDLGACSKTELDFAINRKEVYNNQIKILWTSGNISEGPLVVRKDFSNDLKEKVKNILINLPKDNPVLWESIHKTWSGAVDAVGFVEAKDEFYNSIRKTANNIKDLIAILNNYLD
jgi:phosphonate transport system substrate-binding protein